MPISLHNSQKTTGASDFQGLFAEINRFPEMRPDDNGGTPDFFPIQFPVAGMPINRGICVQVQTERDIAPHSHMISGIETVTAETLPVIRREMRAKLIALFRQTIINITAEGGKSVARDYEPVPGQASPYVDNDDLLIAEGDLMWFLDENDSDFNAAFAHIELGALAAALRAVNFAFAHGDVNAALKWLQKISADYRLESGETVPLTDIPWMAGEGEESDSKFGGKDRRSILAERLGNWECMDHKIKNGKDFERVRARFPSRQKLLQAVFTGFQEIAKQLGVRDHSAAQWFHVLIGNLAQQEFAGDMPRPLVQALAKLVLVFNTASEPRQISAAIDGFVKRTLPEILATIESQESGTSDMQENPPEAQAV